jgi:hypothetical protein
MVLGDRGRLGFASRSFWPDFSRICAWSFAVAVGGVEGHLESGTWCVDGAFATLTGSQPTDRGLPSVWFHRSYTLGPRLSPRQYLESALVMP